MAHGHGWLECATPLLLTLRSCEKVTAEDWPLELDALTRVSSQTRAVQWRFGMAPPTLGGSPAERQPLHPRGPFASWSEGNGPTLTGWGEGGCWRKRTA